MKNLSIVKAYMWDHYKKSLLQTNKFYRIIYLLKPIIIGRRIEWEILDIKEIVEEEKYWRSIKEYYRLVVSEMRRN